MRKSVIILFLGIIYSLNAFGQTTFKIDSVQFKIVSQNEVSVISKTPKYSGDIIIPDSISYLGTRYYVTSIASQAFSLCTTLNSIKIGSKLKSIGDRAFINCTALVNLWLPASVTTIGQYAFASC